MFNLKSFLILILFFKAIIVVAQEKIEFTYEEQEWIKTHPIVHFGFDPNWPPFEMYQNGEYTGILADYIAVIEKRTGISMRPVEIHSFKETVDKLRSGELHVAPEVGKNSQRTQFLDFTEPYLTDPQVIVTRIDAGFVKGLSSLNYKTVSQPEGYTRIKRLKELNPSLKIVTTKDVEECLEYVNTGKAYAFIGSLSVVSYYINNNGFSNLKIASGADLGDINFRLAVTKDWTLFRDISQKVFNSISKDERRKIRNKWIAIRYDHGIDIEEVWNYILLGLLIVLIIFLLFFYWNKTLEKEIRYRKAVEKKLRHTVSIINEKNKEKDTLLKEVHHRVKNNLQMIQSLFNMQSRKVNNEYTRQILAKGKTRVQAISLVHQLLYQSDNFHNISIQNYIITLQETINNIYKQEGLEVDVIVKAHNINLNINQAIPLGLILNELLINSYKYAFEKRDKGQITINITQDDTLINFEYKDDGVGVDIEQLDTTKTLGMSLITRLLSQLETKPLIKNNNGLQVNFKFLLQK
jgi:two-component sensor histidine kinase